MDDAKVELCNVDGRACLVREGRMVDVERRSGGRFGSDPMAVLARFEAFTSWAEAQRAEAGDPALDAARLSACVPRPAQLFAIGLNYRDHAAEAKLEVPAQPMVFTKFPSCLAGPRAQVPLTSDTVDFEIELCAVVGRVAERVSETHALEYVAGYCVGQDISDRRLQFAGAPPQFSLGKSAPGFGPLGPALVARQHVNENALALLCDINGERMQDGNTRDMIFPLPVLIAYLSRHCRLLPGDVIFTGTPAGVGSVRNPRRYLKPGDVIRSEIPGLGVMENECVAEE